MKNFLEDISACISGDERILAAYLLGSAAAGRMRPDSDVDIALLPVAGQTLPARTLMELAGELSAALGRQADIGVLSSQNLIYASQAILTGTRIFCRDVYQADLAAATLLGLAAQFRFERKEIVDAYTH